MNKRCFQVDALGIDAMHAEPIAALVALKLASLALPSTHSPCYGPFQLKLGPERRETTLRAPIARDPCENCELAIQVAPAAAVTKSTR
jgi:hypothetical protein